MSNDKSEIRSPSAESIKRTLGIPDYITPSKPLDERYKKYNERLNNTPHVSERQRKGDILPYGISDLIKVYAAISQFQDLGNLKEFLESCQITPSGITVYSISLDDRIKSYKVTDRTIESLFSLLGIPYHEAAAAQLLKNLRAALDQVSLNKFTSIMNKMKLSVNLINFLSTSYAFYDKYLLYIDEHSKKYQAIFKLNEFLRSKTILKSSEIRNLIKALFNRFAEAERLSPAPGHYELEQLHNNPNYKAVFCLEHKNYVLEVETHEENSTDVAESDIESIAANTAGSNVVEVTKSSSAETTEIQSEENNRKKKKREKSYNIALKKLPPLPRHSIKKLPLENYKRQFGNNSGIALFLEAIAGSVEAADRLAMLFADIAVPGSSNHSMSVIYTSSNDSLILKLLKLVFGIAPDEEPVSVNQLFSSDGKRLLLDKHIKGVPLILVKDILPNYNNISDFAKLMSGKKISVNIAPYPNQYFYSHFHLVCITSKQKIAEEFAELGANIVTLEPKPLASEFSYNLFNTDIIWLRTAFLLHGCRLRYVERKSNRHKPQTITHSSRIFEFFTGHCEIAEGHKIERSEMYNAYCDYHKTEYGCEPTESCVVFIKEMKKLLPSDEMYKVSRYGEDKKTHMCFIGLRFRKSNESYKVHTPLFWEYVNQIEEYADSLVSQVKNPEEIFRVVVK